MAGRIRDEDVVLVKERADIAEVVGEVVTLRPAGGGNLKGLCPFHDEKSPSFSVRPSVGSFHCFGCGEGGDVISFVMRTDHLTFAETVERLADRYGVQLRYEEGGVTPGRQQGQRTRLVEAHRAAAQFYAEQLATPTAAAGRQFLAERSFDQAAAEHFGVGFAPRDWDLLTQHLRGRGFSTEELVTAGLAREGQRGPIDRFMARLLWPIRDVSGDVVGFGARRLFDDDRIEAKYVNTPETPLYKKSTVLYGLDLAKKDIARRLQAVVVEGYTDVMACHLAGVGTAVATCGTAFGSDHIKILRRLLMDQAEFRGEVVFTFDGDSAGQKAALKAFQDDQKFVTQTFVAVEPSGMDPCELRQHKGDTAVRDLVARRVPLFEFAIRTRLATYDLDTAEGRTAATRAGMEVVRDIRDVSLRANYARQLAGWIGLPDPDELVRQSRGGVGNVGRRPSAPASQIDLHDPSVRVERDALKLALQTPSLAVGYDELPADVFTAPPYAALHHAVLAAGGPAAAGEGGAVWVAKVEAAAPDDAARGLVRELAVEPLASEQVALTRYATEVLARLEELAATRRIAEVKSRLQRINPVEASAEYNRLFGELVAFEAHRRALRERAIGTL
ncbi:MAG TPA: DNA primase [Actinomycetes bacterium]|nr:DNA primase [Actinomycetes bacterium]